MNCLSNNAELCVCACGRAGGLGWRAGGRAFECFCCEHITHLLYFTSGEKGGEDCNSCFVCVQYVVCSHCTKFSIRLHVRTMRLRCYFSCSVHTSHVVCILLMQCAYFSCSVHTSHAVYILLMQCAYCSCTAEGCAASCPTQVKDPVPELCCILTHCKGMFCTGKRFAICLILTPVD